MKSSISYKKFLLAAYIPVLFFVLLNAFGSLAFTSREVWYIFPIFVLVQVVMPLAGTYLGWKTYLKNEKPLFKFFGVYLGYVFTLLAYMVLALIFVIGSSMAVVEGVTSARSALSFDIIPVLLVGFTFSQVIIIPLSTIAYLIVKKLDK